MSKGDMTMDNTLQLILDKLSKMDEKMDKLDSKMDRLESKVDDVLLEARQFHGVASEEFDKIKANTESNNSSIEYLAGVTGVHEMLLNRKKN